MIKAKFIALIQQMQNDLCLAVEQADGLAHFIEDKWERAEGGGGITRVIGNGNVFEKGGINTSIVHGLVSDAMRNQLNINGHSWFACGISSVIHPNSPLIPTVHFNYRMFELYDENETVIDRWFGGGGDLTPYYLNIEEATNFHQKYKDACDTLDTGLYPKFKQQCDDYFVNTHRNNERRGIGGIFYDYQRSNPSISEDGWMQLAKNCGYAFLDAYLPIIASNRNKPFTPEQKYWQEIRRGRYTEFNLVHDRGTIFGLKTNGRIESILMSLPPTVRFDYDYNPAVNSAEAILLHACQHPIDWLGSN